MKRRGRGRGGGDGGSDRKRRKRHYVVGKPRDKTLHAGSTGFLCTFMEGKRGLALREVLGILEDYALNEIQGVEGKSSVGAVGAATAVPSDDEEEEDFMKTGPSTAAALESELAQLRKSGLSGSDVFAVADVRSVKGHFFLELQTANKAVVTSTAASSSMAAATEDRADVKDDDSDADIEVAAQKERLRAMPPIDVVELAEKVFGKLIQENIVRTRFVFRCIPIQITCRATVEKICGVLKPMLDAVFPRPAFSPMRYAAEIKVRCNSSVSSSSLLRAITQLIPPVHLLVLREAPITIVCYIEGTVACLSVLRDFQKHRCFNFNAIGDRSAPTSATSTTTASATAAASGADEGEGDDGDDYDGEEEEDDDDDEEEDEEEAK